MPDAAVEQVKHILRTGLAEMDRALEALQKQRDILAVLLGAAEKAPR